MSNLPPFPFAIHDVEETLNARLLQDFDGERTGFVQVGPEKWFFPRKFVDDAATYYNFQVRPDDVWVVTFPRSGTTWTQELVWLLSNNFDYSTAARIPLVDRFPFLEFNTFVHKEIEKECLALKADDPEKQSLLKSLCQPLTEILTQVPSPRFIKTHLPFSLLPPDILEKGCKVIYVARNPKNVAASFFHLNRLIRTQGFLGNFEEYWDYFENNLQPWTPYWTHVIEAWNKRSNPNLLFLFYEEMCHDLPQSIKKIAKFLEKSPTDQQIKTLCNHLEINNFRCNPSVNFSLFIEAGLLREGEQQFIRKGKIGSYGEEFTPELHQRADRWIQKHLENTDLRFPAYKQNTDSKKEKETFSESIPAEEKSGRQ